MARGRSKPNPNRRIPLSQALLGAIFGLSAQHHGASAWSGGAPADASGTRALMTKGFGSVEMTFKSINPTWSSIARQQALLNSQNTVGSNSSLSLPDIIPCG